MLGQHGRGLTKALFTRPALALARIGVTPNMLTVTGTVLTVAVAVTTLPQGRFLPGVGLLALVVVADSFDGILARATGTSSVFGAFLDSTLDRLADGAVFASLAAWAALTMRADSAVLRTVTVCLALACIVLAAAVPYARARAESIGAVAAGGSLSPLEAVVAIGVLLRFMQILVDIGALVSSFETRRPVLELAHEVLSTPELPEPAESAPVTVPGEVVVDSVDFGYEAGAGVLHDVSFRAAPGTMTAIVGPSGCGKTTIARLVCRFYDVDSGAVRVGGNDVRDYSTEDLMEQLSMVFQDVYLFDDTLIANIRVGREDATDEQVMAAARMAGAEEIADRLPLGWSTPVGEGGRALSGGERQRVSVARALLKGSPIVLFDEATSALDPENESHIVEAMEELRRSSTLIVIAHKLDTIASADQIVVLDENGRVVQIGAHQELYDAGGPYRRFWRARERAKGWRLV